MSLTGDRLLELARYTHYSNLAFHEALQELDRKVAELEAQLNALKDLREIAWDVCVEDAIWTR